MRPWQWLGLLVRSLTSYAVFAGAVVMFAVERFGQRFSEHARDYLRCAVRCGSRALAATFSFGVPYLLLAATTRTAIGQIPTSTWSPPRGRRSLVASRPDDGSGGFRSTPRAI
jgi:hypothetical protein